MSSISGCIPRDRWEWGAFESRAGASWVVARISSFPTLVAMRAPRACACICITWGIELGCGGRGGDFDSLLTQSRE